MKAAQSKVGRICWKGRFWAWSERVKTGGWWQRGWLERWVDTWMRRWIETRLVKLTKWIWKLILKTRCWWRIYEWAICDFQGDGWRARKSDNRWRAGTARRLKRDKVVKIARLSGCKNFVGKRERSLYSMRSFTFSQWRDLRIGQVCSIKLACIMNYTQYINQKITCSNMKIINQSINQKRIKVTKVTNVTARPL